MSREEAAAAYIDALLGFRPDFGSLGSAVEVLAETEKELRSQPYHFGNTVRRGAEDVFFVPFK